MPTKRIAGLAAAVAVAGIAFPLMAQQAQPPAQTTPIAPAAPGVVQPAPPSEPGAPPIVRPPVIPRRIPLPAQVPGGPIGPQVETPGVPQAQPGAPLVPRETPAPQAVPAPGALPRRFAAPPAPSAGGMVSLNFNRADLIEIIHIIAQQLRLTYTIDPDVKGSVTINSAEPLRAEDLLPIFHQILRMNGAVAVRTGNLYHIMPIKDGKGLARPVGQSREDSFALQIIPVRFFAVAEMKRVLTPFLQPGGEIIENPRGNFLIVMDLPSSIQRLAEIADMIDVQVFAGTRMEIYQPKVASAEELAQELTKVMQSFAASAPQPESFASQFIALPRINQLLVISHSEAAWTYAKRWLDRIDIVAEGPGRRIFIYPVENGKAVELAEVLSQALGQPSTGRRDTGRTLQDLHRSTPGVTNQGSTTTNRGFGSTGSSSSLGQQSQPLGAYAAVPAPGQVPPPGAVVPTPGGTPVPVPARPPAPQAQQQQQQQQQEQLRIVPDPATNSLIVYGTVQEFQNIKVILRELDAVPRQVLIDAMILQVDLKNSETFGVDYEIMRKFGEVKIFDKTFNAQGVLLSGAIAAFTKGGGLSGVIGTNDTLRAFVTALMTDSRVKLLSSPSVLAADNRPARIQVGAEVPIPTGTITASTGAIGSSTTIQYRNTGRILTIIPQVNAQGLVNLQIKAEVSALGDNIAVGGNGETFPTFNTQDAETTAVVQDGETLVIGGLIGEIRTRSRSGIPYLMDLPVVGRFFGTTLTDSNRTELIMLITPRVIRSREEARYATDEFKAKLNSVRNELERMERERAASQPKVAPPEIPLPEPKASEEKPPFAPSNFVPRQGASIAPNRSNVTVLSNRGRPLPPQAPGQGREASASMQAGPAYPYVGSMIAVTPESRAPAPPAAGASSSAAQASGVRGALPPASSERQSQPQAKQWAVQVAAFADRKDADAMVQGLRGEGYDAYVLTTQSEIRTWHRVRVGQFPDIGFAKQLRQSLAQMPPFKGAYVAVH
jgi:general secretion pathway protein D